MPDTDGSDDPLQMIQLRLQTRGLTEIGKMLGLDLERVDDQYLVHCALGKLFQDDAPKPFSLENKQGRHITVLGYAGVDAEQLHTNAQAFAEPAVYERACDWDQLASKPMPHQFPEGAALGFELQACPVVRKSSDGPHPQWNEGAEVDAFLSKVWEVDDKSVDISREEVYLDWLDRQFDVRGGATVNESSMQRFSLERMYRRTHGQDRDHKTIKRPDVTIDGTLTVTDPDQFSHLLESGIGRHKSFGYGMLKVRPA
jgi:CRISPR system Cascade subunit CasE